MAPGWLWCGRGVGAPGVWGWGYQVSVVVVCVGGVCWLLMRCCTSSGVLVPIQRLHLRCVRTQFVGSRGLPPLLIGMSSWTSGELGWPGGRLGFMGCWQVGSQQCVSLRLIVWMSWLRRWPFCRRGLVIGCPVGRGLVDV